MITGIYKWLTRCRKCDVDCISRELFDAFKNMQFSSVAKGCAEYVCKKCGTRWTLAGNSRWLNKVVRTDLYESWKSKRIDINDLQESTLRQIGGVIDSDQSNIYYPCSLEIDGKITEKAIVIETNGCVFGKFPFGQTVRAMDVKMKIMVSDYALPLEIRKASAKAKEVSMGYAPLNVIHKNGDGYTLHNEMHFIDHAGLRGSEFAVGENNNKRRKIIHSAWADAYYICDPFSGRLAQQGDAHGAHDLVFPGARRL